MRWLISCTGKERDSLSQQESVRAAATSRWNYMRILGSSRYCIQIWNRCTVARVLVTAAEFQLQQQMHLQQTVISCGSAVFSFPCACYDSNLVSASKTDLIFESIIPLEHIWLSREVENRIWFLLFTNLSLPLFLFLLFILTHTRCCIQRIYSGFFFK